MAWPLHVSPSPSCSLVPLPRMCTCANLLSGSRRCQFLFLFASVVHVIPVGENVLPTSPRSQLKCYFVRETYPGLPLRNLAMVFFLQGIHHTLYPYTFIYVIIYYCLSPYSTREGINIYAGVFYLCDYLLLPLFTSLTYIRAVS